MRRSVVRRRRRRSIPPDKPRCGGCFDLRDEVERIRRGIKKTGPMVEGSQGQPVVNPAYRVLTSLLSEIRQLEDRFSMNPQAAVKLGLQVQEGRKNILEEFAESVRGDDG
jgi:P27 family predicted phage terminase small subunit